MLVPVLLTLAASPVQGAVELPLTWCTPLPQGRTIHELRFLDDQSGVAVGPLGTVLVTSDGGGTWNDLSDYPSLQQDLHGALMLGGGGILAVGESPGVFRSNDGGNTWAAVPNPSTATLLDIERAGTGMLSAAGEDGQVLRSSDEGATWTAATSPGQGAIKAQAWLDAQTGFVVGDFLAQRTDDGGQTWTQMAGTPVQNFYTDIRFLDDGMHGYLTPSLGTMLQTGDGGLTWSLDTPHGPDYPAELVLLSPSERLLSLDGEGAQIWHTSDNGASWTQLLMLPHTGGFPAFERLPGGRLVAGSTFGDLMYSDDLGATWTNAVANPDNGSAVPVSAIAITPLGHGFAGSYPSVWSNEPIWLETVDGGATWALAEAAPEVGKAHVVEFRGEDWGLAGGLMPNTIARTVDGGASWSHHSLPAPSGVSAQTYAIAMPTDQVALVSVYSMSNGALLRTTDRGETWQPAGAGIPQSSFLRGIEFPSAEVGYAAGQTFSGFTATSQVYRTTDVGLTWASVSGPLAAIPLDLVFLDEDTGLFTSSTGIWRTSDGGRSWQQVHGEAMKLIEFTDPLRGLATPDWTPGLVPAVYTFDGGLTWHPAPVPLNAEARSLRAALGGFFLGGAGTKIARVDPTEAWLELEPGLAGTHGFPHLSGEGTLAAFTPVSFRVANALEQTPAVLVFGLSQLDLPILGGTLVPALDVIVDGIATDAEGELTYGALWPGSFLSGTPSWTQAWVFDPAAIQGFASTNALLGTTP